MFDALICVGRFQPPQRYHAEVLKRLADKARTLVVICGSSERPRAVDQPWFAAERVAMLEAVLRAADVPDSRVLALRDVPYDDARWARACAALVVRELPAARQIALVGLERRRATDYAALFPAWSCHAPPSVASGWVPDLAQRLWRAPAVAPALLAAHCPDVVQERLAADLSAAPFRPLIEEQRHLDDYRQSWANAPFPPVFVTVDAVVTAGEHVLLVRRGRDPGAGLLALPGGFIDPTERLYDAAVRELGEETSIPLSAARLAAALREVRVFDAPFRSLRGRTITHAHRFDLGDSPAPPPVKGGDDAAAALWAPVATLDPAVMFEDHYAILQIMLGVD